MKTPRLQYAILVALAVSACGSGSDDAALENATSRDARPPTGAPDTAPRPAPRGSFAERVPDSVLVRRGACPFECCTYGEWALESAAPVRTAADTAAPAVLTLAANQRFRADSGFVRITSRALVALHDTVDQRPYAAVFVPGDTLLVLDYVGEGHYKVWTGTRVVEVEGFWGAEAARPTAAELIGRYAREWWVHVTADARQGWLLIEPALRLIGADACGAPPPWRAG